MPVPEWLVARRALSIQSVASVRKGGCGTDGSFPSVTCFVLLSFHLPFPRMPCPPFLSFLFFFYLKNPRLTEFKSRWVGRVTRQPCPLVFPSGLVSVKALGSSPGLSCSALPSAVRNGGPGHQIGRGTAAEDGMVAFCCQLIWRVGVRCGWLAAPPPFFFFFWVFFCSEPQAWHVAAAA